MYVREMFGLRYDKDGYFNSLCIFIQKFILCAASQAHRDIKPVNQSNGHEEESKHTEQDIVSQAQLAHQAVEPIKEKYSFGIHELYAAFWCNDGIISALTKILSIYETKYMQLSQM
eukprot:656403_1